MIRSGGRWSIGPLLWAQERSNVNKEISSPVLCTGWARGTWPRIDTGRFEDRDASFGSFELAFISQFIFPAGSKALVSPVGLQATG